MDWKTLLACITGSVEEQLLLRNAYVLEENRSLRNQIAERVQLTAAERRTLAEIGQQLGQQALEDVATIVTPATLLAWHRTLVAQKFDGSAQRTSVGRPRVDQEIEDLVMQMAQENRRWGSDRIAGALAELGYDISDQRVGTMRKRRGLPTAPARQKTTPWKACIRTHREVLWATDFFSIAVWTLGGLVTFYVLFFIKLATREVRIAGVTAHPHAQWMRQVARHATREAWGFLESGQYLLHDRDRTYGEAFSQMLDDTGVTRLPLPPRSPWLNAYAERWVKSVQDEALSRVMRFGDSARRHVLSEYVEHDHQERCHQGLGNVIPLCARQAANNRAGPIECRERLGGLLKYYNRKAA